MTREPRGAKPRLVIARASLLGLLSFVAACQSGAAVGTSCTRDSECSASLVCRLGRCRAACVENRDCPLGTQCFLVAGGGACQLEVDRSCAASCPDGLSCLADQCLRACAGSGDCPADGACAIGSGASVGVCTDPRTEDASVPTSDAGVDAANVPDVGAPDTGGVDAAGGDAGGDAGTSCRVVRHVAAGGSTTCAILDDQSVACWGYDMLHQTGSAPSGEVTALGATYRSQPAYVVDQTGSPIHVDQIGVSDLHACGLTSDGQVLCWGAAITDLRGDGSVITTEYATPAMFDEPGQVPWGSSPAPAAALLGVGREHVCAVAADQRTARCWGRNQFGQIADGSRADVGVAPTSPTTLLDALPGPIVALVLGDGYTCAVDDTHHLACIGQNDQGQLGLTNVGGVIVTAAVDPGVPTRSLVGGESFLCGLDVMGVASCLGVNARQQLGRMTFPDRDPDPHALPVAGTTHFDALASGAMASATFARVGTSVYAWGDNFRGGAALVPVDGIRPSPQRVASLTDVVELSIDQGSGCAVSTTGVLSCWGANDLAQLGRGAITADDPTPRPVCIPPP